MSNDNRPNDVAILGIFVADLGFQASRLPKVGETIIGSGFSMGPGGKGANQAVAAARAGASTAFISKLGQDSFGDMALETWAKEGIATFVSQSDDQPTGAAFVFVNDLTGDNAIIVVPGAAGTITVQTVNENAATIEDAQVFITQLEQSPEAALRALEIARTASTITIFNPAPAVDFDEAIFPLCDYITPNESEASALTGIDVQSVDDAKRAGNILLKKGVGCALITLGSKGALFHSLTESEIIPSISVGKIVDTTGAGDAFNGSFAAALASGKQPLEAVRFSNIAAGISVTRAGTAPSMATIVEIEEYLNRTAKQ